MTRDRGPGQLPAVKNETSMESVIGLRMVTGAGLAQAVNVREMKWGKAIAFVRLLSAELAGLITVDARGKPNLDLSKLPEIVGSSETVSRTLILSSTELTDEELDELPAGTVLELLEAAIDMNLTEELLGKGRRIGAKVSGVFGASPQAPAPPAVVPA